MAKRLFAQLQLGIWDLYAAARATAPTITPSCSWLVFQCLLFLFTSWLAHPILFLFWFLFLVPASFLLWLRRFYRFHRSLLQPWSLWFLLSQLIQDSASCRPGATWSVPVENPPDTSGNIMFETQSLRSHLGINIGKSHTDTNISGPKVLHMVRGVHFYL